ncbi:MAG: AbiV family abortive infection protein [Mesorhizobium sp.]|uniref:AbiV family abortive infection protein n=1 Tax=Mesorhizobium sp. M7A.F.Ca.ET.027.02.1.1 TaxID=2496655 RepID=UPI000FD206D4|nr:AbiV family abortive infection protein [Mesorhizobium sp. M7A.F.Ca.ET.027.02.1.1]RVD14614.1 AbiV family abortive infection protein [Mesorhizobium sp. M7A.F.Ca.ET.027.02.1.1]RWD00993.1 MAG: AbiV family abortive infection protein [Mesorhizobium sp.]
MGAQVVVAEKALSLAQDARLLFDNGRFETALSLAILSIEEAGKFILLAAATSQGDLNRKIRSHPKKQQQAALSLLVRQMITGLKVLKQITEPEQWLDPANQPTDEDYRRVWRVLSLTGIFDFHKAAHAGDLDRLKQAGFYVDLNQERLSAEAFKELAVKWLPQAETLADDVVMLSRTQPPVEIG